MFTIFVCPHDRLQAVVHGRLAVFPATAAMPLRAASAD
jgi:hypothetical protein